MNDNNKMTQTNLGIEDPLHDIITDEFSCTMFECKINDCSPRWICSKWYKDGKELKESRRIKMSNDGRWHRLEITSVTSNDYGVYVILLNNGYSEVYSKANLYVNEIKDRNNNDVLYINPKLRYVSPIRHMRCAKVLVGDIIELEAIFNEDILDDYRWYKSNRLLLPNERMIVLNDKKTTTLSILCAKENDSGIYHVVCKTEYGIASSFASVVVINTDLSTLNNSEITPSIDEPLPEEFNVNEGEEARLMCKATYDRNTTIYWSKTGVIIEENENTKTEFYNNRYTCLIIKNTCVKDAGEYTIRMRDDITGRTDTSSCLLSVNHSSKDKPDLVALKVPLQPSVTCIGSKLSFHCAFALNDPKYYYVVWYIGHYRVERTNHRFQVLSNGGDFYLIIKQTEPGMSGEVTCELCKALPNRKLFVVNSTTTYLTIVPPEMIANEIKNYKATLKRNIFRNSKSKLYIPIKKATQIINGSHKTNIITNGIDARKEGMIITYCRLNNNNFYFDVINESEELKHIDQIVIHEELIYTPQEKSKSLIIEWCSTTDPSVSFNSSRRNWFDIEYGRIHNDLVKAGISSLPIFEVKDPPLEQIMKFRIYATNAVDKVSEARISILPDDKEFQGANNQCALTPMEEFDSIFTKTGDLLGTGGFGSVVLVCDNKGKFYAAKILKTRTQKKRDTALREYEIMKSLKHPKLVQLHFTFTAKESFIFIMDYLWGGELFDRLVEEEYIKEVDVVPYVRQICEALQYLHNHKIAHLDIKPENIVCLSPNSLQVKLIDFGLARILDDKHITRVIYGTRDYMAPEVLNFEQLTLACDMWSLGVVTYVLLSGVMPFSGDSWPERSANITRANYNYHDSAFKDISDLAKDFVDHLLVLQPRNRMNAPFALNHKWIVEGPGEGEKAGHMKRTRQNLKSYLANNKARWQRAGNVMIAAQRLRNAGSQRNSLDAEKVSHRVT